MRMRILQQLPLPPAGRSAVGSAVAAPEHVISPQISRCPSVLGSSAEAAARGLRLRPPGASVSCTPIFSMSQTKQGGVPRSPPSGFSSPAQGSRPHPGGESDLQQGGDGGHAR